MNNNKKISEDFLESFLNMPEVETDAEFYETERRYAELFGHGLPGEMLPDGISDGQIKKAMEECIFEHTDNLFERLGVKIDDDYIY